VANERSTATLRRKELGNRLRGLRTGLNLTLDDVAARLMCSSTKVSRIEGGGRTVSLRDIRDLCQIYGTSESTSNELMSLARDSRQSSWWQAYDDVNYGSFIGLEQSAKTISDYNALIVPGLLQVEPYSRALISDLEPDLPAEAIESRVSARLKRQEVLQQGVGAYLWVILDEVAFQRPIGDWSTMAIQVKHLIDVSRLSNIHLQIVNRATGAYAGYSFPFTLLEFSQADVGDIVYIEGYSGDLYLERSEDVTKYRNLFNNLRSAGRGPRESRAYLENLLAELSARAKETAPPTGPEETRQG